MPRASDSYTWLPGFVRRFLNLDDDLPRFDDEGDYEGVYDDRSAATYRSTATPAPSYTQSEAYAKSTAYTQSGSQSTGYGQSGGYGQSSNQAYSQNTTSSTYSQSFGYTQGVTTPTGPDQTYDQSYGQSYGQGYGQGYDAAQAPAPQRFAAEPARPLGPPPPVIRSTGAGRPGAPVTPGANLPPTAPEGYVQPVGYLFRSYARGALPPQGLEQFTRETRATLSDVWNFYSYWTRFQSEELFRIGRELMDTVFEDDRTTVTTTTTNGSIRRIKVTPGTSTDLGINRVATTTTVDPPPAPTPAAPPVPPAPTARFSSTVTADDAVIPPEGRNAQAEFEARTADATDTVRSDIGATTGEVRQDVASDAKAAAADLQADVADAATNVAQDMADAAKNVAQDVADTARDAARNADKQRD